MIRTNKNTWIEQRTNKYLSEYRNITKIDAYLLAVEDFANLPIFRG